jgi:hypothetical protein
MGQHHMWGLRVQVGNPGRWGIRRRGEAAGMTGSGDTQPRWHLDPGSLSPRKGRYHHRKALGGRSRRGRRSEQLKSSTPLDDH